MTQVLLLDARCASGQAVRVLQGSVDVTIIDDDDGGVLSFELPTIEVRAGRAKLDKRAERLERVDYADRAERAKRAKRACRV